MARYSVTDSETFKEQRALLEKTVPRLAEALKGLKWALQRKPYIFGKIEEVSGLRLAKLRGLRTSNADEIVVRVFFKLLPSEKVVLEWIEILTRET